jgi:hypothetical protein
LETIDHDYCINEHKIELIKEVHMFKDHDSVLNLVNEDSKFISDLKLSSEDDAAKDSLLLFGSEKESFDEN